MRAVQTLRVVWGNAIVVHCEKRHEAIWNFLASISAVRPLRATSCAGCARPTARQCPGTISSRKSRAQSLGGTYRACSVTHCARPQARTKPLPQA
eukprot:4552715-Pyramimonas_sp.AAC.1